MNLFSTAKDLLTHLDGKFILYLIGMGTGLTGLMGSWVAWARGINEQPQTEVITSEKSSPQVLVEITGAVSQPGLYPVPLGDRVGQVVAAAGGLRSEADPEFVAKQLNLAEAVKDGQKVYVPFATEEESGEEQKNIQINLNQALATELENLPGIGKVKAEKIITARPIASFENLVDQKILTVSEIEKIKDLITL